MDVQRGLAAAIAAGLTTLPLAAAAQPAPAEIPIIYNDHTVHAVPDRLLHGRVLAAQVEHGHIMLPLRAMFEAMGAAVSASADGRTVTAAKSGSSVSVTVGVAEVRINGERRPLDVAPMIADGIVLVPVRVISESLGAYVQWIPDRRIVVVRLPAAPIPAPPPVAPPAPAPPTAAPAPAPIVTAPPLVVRQHSYTAFVQGADAAPRNYTEFVDGVTCPKSYVISGAIAPLNSRFALAVDFRQDVYVTSRNLTDGIGNEYTQFATIDGGTSLTSVFQARQSSLDARLEYRIAASRLYVGVGYLHTENTYGYPQLNGIGAGVQKLPDLHAGLSVFGSVFYYPNALGTYTVAQNASIDNGIAYQQSYAVTKFDAGVALAIHASPVYLYGGYDGEHDTAKRNAPIGQIHDGPYAGLGVKI